jgi:dihydropteroate synthase-like protein
MSDKFKPGERLLFLTGHLAEPRLRRVLEGLGTTPFRWEILDIGVKVAALMTEAIIARRMAKPVPADRVIVPGRCRADLDRLGAELGVPVLRGPDEIADLPAFLGRGGSPPDLSRTDISIFAEIVEATELSVDEILAKAGRLSAAGADVIDLGCLPDTLFPHLEEAIGALKAVGLKVSLDSADPGELARGNRAGADYLLSLTAETLDIAGEGAAIPVLIPARPGDLASLLEAIDKAEARGISYLADPVLDPIHFGFTASLLRYAELRRLRPDAEILMGTGNLTELTDADSGGVTALLIGICSELAIRSILCVQVSPHTRRTVQEHDAARRLMFAAREDRSLPRGYGNMLLGLHDRKPFPVRPEEIAAIAGEVRDANYRIEAAADGVHIYNRDAHHIAGDAFSLFPKLGVEADGAHAFYLGAELTKAEIAYRLGKRYAQDELLDWGIAADRPEGDKTRLAEAGHTLRAKSGS